MKSREIVKNVHWMGAIDWNRRLFDSLIPLPDGTSYNAYLIEGSEKIALLDSVDPPMKNILDEQLKNVPRIDFIVSHHTEQDHSGLIPDLLQRYPESVLVCSSKAKPMLIDHLNIPADRIRVVEDGASISLGDKTLQFYYTPWVHWPETMVTYLAEDRILFSCDFFGSHLATTELYSGDDPHVLKAAKRYFAEIMMPFRKPIQGNMAKISKLDFSLIAPSHGPIHDKPRHILDAYTDWISDKVSNLVVLPYITMHGSTQIMVDHLIASLVAENVKVEPFNLAVTDIGELAMALTDAATVVIGTPTVHAGPHPLVFNATHLANALRPKLKYAAIIGSYGWGTRAVEQIAGLIPNLKVEILGTVLCKGLPSGDTFAALDDLAKAIGAKHKEL